MNPKLQLLNFLRFQILYGHMYLSTTQFVNLINKYVLICLNFEIKNLNTNIIIARHSSGLAAYNLARHSSGLAAS